MNFTAIILQLVSGGVGGNIAGALLKKLTLDLLVTPSQASLVEYSPGRF